jgi:hypothetical protein
MGGGLRLCHMTFSDQPYLRNFLSTWWAFAVAALPAMVGSIWATGRLGSLMTAIDLAEWALLIALLTVVGSISQFGIKPGYMQEVTDRGGEARYGALRAGLFAVGCTGALAGLIVASALYGLSLYGQWHNLAVLPWLPLYGVLANIGMMLHTDLRILGGARILAMIAIVTFPLFVGLLELVLWLQMDPLAAFFASQCAISLIVGMSLSLRSGVLAKRDFDYSFLSRALTMGLPVMGGLLAKYVADFSVAATFRWAVDEQSAGAFGLAVRSTEPLMILYIGSFQMAWGAHVYGWIKDSPNGDIVANHSSRSWWILYLGIPLGISLAWMIVTATRVDTLSIFEWGFVAMMISRTLAFGMASAMAFGQTMRRNYRQGMNFALGELALSATLIPLAAIASDAIAAVITATLIPWFTVWRLRAMSRAVHRESRAWVDQSIA